MTNDDKQTTVPSSTQESLPELEEQELATITGGGWFSRLFKGGKNTTSKPEGAQSHENAQWLNPLYKQAGLSERYRPGGDGNFYLKK